MVDSLSESESDWFPCLAGGGGGSAVSLVLASSLVSPLSPLSIKVCRGSGNVSVTRVGLLLRVLAATGVLLVDIQASCIVGGLLKLIQLVCANKCQDFWMLLARDAYTVACIKMATWLWLPLKLSVFASSASIFVNTAVFKQKKVSM